MPIWFWSSSTAEVAAESLQHVVNDPKSKCVALGRMCVPLAVGKYGNWGREAQGRFSWLVTLLAARYSVPKSKVYKCAFVIVCYLTLYTCNVVLYASCREYISTPNVGS